MLDDALSRGFAVLVLTNAMQPMQRPMHARRCWRCARRFGDAADAARQPRPLHAARCTTPSGARARFGQDDRRARLAGAGGFRAWHVAGRTCWQRGRGGVRAGYRARCSPSAAGPSMPTIRCALVLFPEMDAQRRRAGDHHAPAGASCRRAPTGDVRLEPHGGEAARAPRGRRCWPARCSPTTRSSSWAHAWPRRRGAVPLNHPHCAKFCVLGGAACSR